MRSSTSRLIAVTSALLLALTACGSDSADDAGDAAAGQAVTTTAAAPETDAAGDEGSSAEVRGVVDVDGVSYDVTELRRCEPEAGGSFERELELQGLGEHDGERVQIDVYVQKIGGAPYDDVSWSGPEGIFGSPEDADVTYDAAGGTVSGTATLNDARSDDRTVAVEFDLAVPEDTVACR